MKEQNRKAGLFYVITGATLWGIGGTVSQKLFQQYALDVNWLVATRLLLAGLLLLTIRFLAKDGSHLFAVWKSKWAATQIIIFALFGMLTVQYTYMASISHGNAAVATLLQYLSPLLIIGYLLLRKQTRFTQKDAVLVLLALVGCFFLLTNGSFAGLSVPLPAIGWGLLSAAAAAFYTLYAVPLLKTFDSLVIVGWAMVIGGFILSFVHPPWRGDFHAFSLELVLYLIVVIVFGTMFAFWFYVESLQTLSPKETSLIGTLEPLAAVLSTVFWLNEPFGAFQWLGTACILGMIVVLALVKDTKKKQPLT